MELIGDGLQVVNSQLRNISTWYTANVTNMNGMFQGASSFNQNIRRSAVLGPFGVPTGNEYWNTSKVVFMSSMFNGASAFSRDISNWYVPLIPSKPTGFNDGTSGVTLPVWGTCPSV